MDLDTLKYFVDVVDLKNFTQAAKNNFISQPAISVQIRQLEMAVGKPLLVRDHHHVSVTPAGQIFYRAAKQILQTYHQSVMDIWRPQPAEAVSKLRSSVFITPEFQPYINQLVSFRTAFPEIAVTVQEKDSSQAVKDVLTGNAELGFGIIDHSERKLLWRQEFTDKLVIVASTETLAGAPAKAGIDHLQGNPYLTLTQVPVTQFVTLTKSVLADYQFVEKRISSLDLLFTQLLMGKGFALLPASQVPQGMKGLSTRLVATDLPVTMDVGWCYQKHPLEPVVGTFLAYLNTL